MADDTRYNGWKNRETWLIALHIDNDEGLYNYWHEAARRARRRAPRHENVQSGIWTVQETERFTLADRLKDSFEAKASRIKNPLLADLAGTALADVDWHDVADHYLDAISEETAAS